MLETDPTERVSAAEALEMIKPAVSGTVQFPQTGPLLQLDVAAEPQERGAKRARKETERDGPSVATLCSKLGIRSPQTAASAQEYLRRSPAARDAGLAGRAACVLLGCKMFEPETWMPHDLCEVAELADFDTDAYPELELAVLNDLGFCLVLPPSGSADALRERN
jgi:hypothetical protein